MSDGRTTILARVREALSIPTDTKFLHFRQHDGAAPADPRSFMPPCGDNAKDRIELFGKPDMPSLAFGLNDHAGQSVQICL